MKITDSSHRLIELMKITGDSQNDIARKSNIPKSSISHYVNGVREPRQEKLSRISDAYNINPAWLMGFDVPMELETKNINEDKEKNDKALELYETYKNATPQIRNAIDSLLGFPRQDS